MFAFVLKVIVVSILCDLIASWLKLVPRYKLRYSLVMHAIDTALVTAALTLIVTAEVYPSWALLLLLLLLFLWLSVLATNAIARRRGESAEKPPPEKSVQEPRA